MRRGIHEMEDRSISNKYSIHLHIVFKAEIKGANFQFKSLWRRGMHLSYIESFRNTFYGIICVTDQSYTLCVSYEVFRGSYLWMAEGPLDSPQFTFSVQCERNFSWYPIMYGKSVLNL